jgi:phosphomannomutase/phosphoglucomutase
MDRKLFGTSGVRGYTNREITSQLAMGIGESVGSFFRQGKKACVAQDTRFGASMVVKAAASGLMAQGIDVLDCGCVPTSVLAYYLASTAADCGIMVTGSHLPPDMIGIIPLMGDGAYMPDTYTSEVENIFWNQTYRTTRTSNDGVGSFCAVSDALDRYTRLLFSLVNIQAVRARAFRVAVDPANGTACGILADILRKCGCTVTEVNGKPSGAPGRDPEPRASTLTCLKEVIVNGDFDVGVGLDTDADRVVFFDERGIPVSEDVVGIIFADYVFLGLVNDVLVTPVNSSGIVEWFMKSRDAVLEYCRIGQPATVEAIKKTGAVYSYEESGKYYFSRKVNWCDGFLATLKMLEILARARMSLSEVVAFYPTFSQVKKTLNLPAEKKEKIMSLIGQHILDILGENTAQLVDIDGYKLIYPDNSWLLVRASGTEPILRVYSDSPSEKRAEDLVKEGLRFATEVIEDMK